MKRLFAWMFNLPLVYLESYEYNVELRLAKLTMFDKFICAFTRNCYVRTVRLFPDGRTSHTNYWFRWIPANKKAQQILEKLKANNE